jgi:hypothetical protein
MMNNYKRNLFLILLSVLLITSFIPDAKGFFRSGGFILNGIPLLLDIIIVALIIFQFKWVTHAIIIWSAWQIIVTLLLLYGIIFIMTVSRSNQLPLGWVALQIIFGVLKVIGICYLLYVLNKIKVRSKEMTL